MIVVDTSVWVAALRDRSGAEAARFRELLDRDAVALVALVRIEILAGTGATTQPRLRRLLSALPLWIPSPATWAQIDPWLETAAAAGERFAAADLLIAAGAAEHNARIWSLDRDFNRMARLGFVELFEAA